MQTVKIDRVNFKAYRVEHSIRAPAVGYWVSVKAASFFYLPDVAKLPNLRPRSAASMSTLATAPRSGGPWYA
jgi:hypothetical protein